MRGVDLPDQPWGLSEDTGKSYAVDTVRKQFMFHYGPQSLALVVVTLTTTGYTNQLIVDLL